MAIHVEVEDASDPRRLEVDLDFPREWIEFLDPAVNALFRVTPHSVFSLTEDDFTGSPTRWTLRL